MALKTLDTQEPRILKLKLKIHELSLKNKSIILAWIPSRVGIDSNEMADELAKYALESEIANIKLPYTDYKPKIKTTCHLTMAEQVVKTKTKQTP